MSAEMSIPLGSAGTMRLVADVRSTNDAVRGGGWDSGSYGSGDASVGSTGDPLSALVGSGFGFLADLVPFLGEPLQQLAGDPGAITTSAQSLQEVGGGVTSISDSYGQAAGPETSGWSGAAATEYLKTAAELVGGLRGIGEASTGLGEALAGMGDALAKTANEVTILVNEAVGRIVIIMNQALAAAQATFGASIAAAIPQVVQVAAEYGVRISGHMGNLLTSAQGLLGHVDEIVKVLSAVGGVVSKIADQAEQVTVGSTAPGGPSAASAVPAAGLAPSADGSSLSPGLTSAASVVGGSPSIPSPGGTASAGPIPGTSQAAGASAGTGGGVPSGAAGFGMGPVTSPQKQQSQGDSEHTSPLSARLSGSLDFPEHDDPDYGPRYP